MQIIFIVFFFAIFFIIFKSVKSSFGMFNLHSSIFKHVNKSLELSLKERELKLKQQQNYNCSNCNATLDNPEDISPSGDVKCKHCSNWFNVYRK